jgi:phage-related protein
MAVKLADAVTYIRADSSELKNDLGSAEREIEGSGNRFSSILQGVGMAVGMGIANIAVDALGKVQQFMGDSVAAASDLNETVSKVGVVFGESSTQVLAWSENAATALGQSKQQALDAAGTFGNLFVSMGMAADTSADMSMGLVQMASDLASFNNMDPGEVLEKLRSGLLGQTEPLQSLGVNLTAAAVQQKALEMGLAATTDELTPAMLAQARYALILDQTKTAQGDFARTSDGLANQQRILDAQWKDLQSTVGQALLPVVLAFTSAMNQLAQRVLPPLASFISGTLMPVMTQIGDVIASSVGPVIEQAQGWFSGLGETMRGQADGPMAYLKTWFDTNMPRIQQIVNTVLSAIQGFWDEHGAQITETVTGFLTWLAKFWDTQFRTILDIVTIALQLLTGDFEGAGNTLRMVVNRWETLITGAMRALVDNIKRIWTSIDWGGIGKAIIDGIASGIRNAGGAILDAARTAAQNALTAAKQALGISSPSRVAAEQVGRPFAEGIGVGLRESMAGLAGDISAGLSGMMGGIQQPAAAAAGPISITLNITGGDAQGVGAAAQTGVLAALRAAGLR